jgi:hypothetical protein
MRRRHNLTFEVYATNGEVWSATNRVLAYLAELGYDCKVASSHLIREEGGPLPVGSDVVVAQGESERVYPPTYRGE